jgi:hypothetical protein
MKFASISALGLAMASNASIAFSLSICTAHFIEEEANARCVSEIAMTIGLNGGQRLESAYIDGLPLDGNKLKGFVAMDSHWMKSSMPIVCHSFLLS